VTDIKICTEENSAPTSSDIVICDEEDTFEPLDIKICEDDGRFEDDVFDPCLDAPAMSVTISEPVSVGDFIIGSGGIGPFVYSFGGGSVDSATGEILTITACSGPTEVRSANVTATDTCGNSAILNARLIGGTWKLLGDTTYSPFFQLEQCWTFGAGNPTVSRVNGFQRWDDSWIALIFDGGGDPVCDPPAFECVAVPSTENPFPPSQATCVQRKRYYEWRCI
jgi:hypothetical protein